jgi:hypothetical protein
MVLPGRSFLKSGFPKLGFCEFMILCEANWCNQFAQETGFASLRFHQIGFCKIQILQIEVFASPDFPNHSFAES